MNVQRGQRAVLTALLALVAADAAAALTAAEQQIVAAVKERSVAALQFLERTVNVNSGTLNPEGVREVGRMFRAEFDQLGFTTRWVDLPPAMQRAGHLVAAREGKQRSEEHTSELQSHHDLVCRLLLEKKNTKNK